MLTGSHRAGNYGCHELGYDHGVVQSDAVIEGEDDLMMQEAEDGASYQHALADGKAGQFPD